MGGQVGPLAGAPDRREVLLSAAGDLASRLDTFRVASALERSGLRGRTPSSLLLWRGWPARDGGLLALFAESGSAGGPPWWSLHVLPARESGANLRARYDRALHEGSAAYLQGIDGIAQLFPSDLRLSRLAEALDRRAVGRLFEACAAASARSYKPSSRCVIRYEVSGAGGEARAWWGKIYRRGLDAAVRLIYEGLHRRVKPPGSAGSVPVDPPARRFPRWSMLLWPEAAGDRLGSLSAAAAVRAAPAAGRALAALHRAPAAWTESHDPDSELEILSRWVHAAAALDERRSALLRVTAEAVRSLARVAPAGSMRPAHRDFHENQVLVSRDRVSILDLDTACLAEPELDVGNFLAHLRIRSFLEGAAGGAGEMPRAFLDAYRGTGSRLRDERIDWYRMTALLRLACVHSFRPRARGLVGFLLEEAAEAAGVARQQVMT